MLAKDLSVVKHIRTVKLTPVSTSYVGTFDVVNQNSCSNHLKKEFHQFMWERGQSTPLDPIGCHSICLLNIERLI